MVLFSFTEADSYGDKEIVVNESEGISQLQANVNAVDAGSWVLAWSDGISGILAWDDSDVKVNK
ncbi:Uncharacterised protein [Candidatus Ornithobacterium hominis]|uniref:hypothetical protein n=1 Tax=Candidatus Ornithobacterium hominis TaxID=2497989 RepID=UPI000E5C2A10|nr:hypothetical protein [Candidatus Ornithobacterium hominis]SZD73694.1 Uncharacterised protein [Candidatus Ornithobacterium hominis]